MSDYDVDRVWKAVTPSDVDGCFHALLDKRDCLFHGAHEKWEKIESSLDLEIKKHPPQEDKHTLEKRLLEGFGKQCFHHLLPGARRHIELARLRWNTYRTTGTMFVARHFGFPTRSVDWTQDALVAMFFACRRAPDEDGVIWSMDRQEFLTCVASQWPQAYGKKEDILDDFEQDFIEGNDKDILVPVKFPPWMPQAVAQNALITVGGQFDIDHAHKIHQLGVADCGRVVVPAALKRKVIKKLDLMGVHGYTLEIGASTVETIASDIAAGFISETGTRCCQSEE